MDVLVVGASGDLGRSVVGGLRDAAPDDLSVADGHGRRVQERQYRVSAVG